MFFPKRDHGIYFGSHRKRVWNAKHSGALAIAKLEKEVESLKHRVSELSAVPRAEADPSPLGAGQGLRPKAAPMGVNKPTPSIGRVRAAVK